MYHNLIYALYILSQFLPSGTMDRFVTKLDAVTSQLEVEYQNIVKAKKPKLDRVQYTQSQKSTWVEKFKVVNCNYRQLALEATCPKR